MSQLDFPKALDILAKANSDNERLAALLIVAKNAPQSSFGEEDIQKLVDTIGVDFYIRLVRSSNANSDYRSFCEVLGSLLLQNRPLLERLNKCNLLNNFTKSYSSKESLECVLHVVSYDKDVFDQDVFAKALRMQLDSPEPEQLVFYNRLLKLCGISEDIIKLLEAAPTDVVHLVELLDEVDLDGFDERSLKLILPILGSVQNMDSEFRSKVILRVSSLSNSVGLAQLSVIIEQDQLELLLRLTMIELQHLLMISKDEIESTSSAVYAFFSLLEQYLMIFSDESIERHQVILSKLTNEMIERIEKQMTELVAVLSGVQHFSSNDLIILAVTKFLASWLQCESRAATSHGIAENLIGLARLARKNEEWDVVGFLLSGFYKATDSEDGAKIYFSDKVDLQGFCFENVKSLAPMKVLELCVEITTEYFIFAFSYGSSMKDEWRAFPALLMKAEVEVPLYAAAVLKLTVIEPKSFNKSCIKQIVDYLQGAYSHGKLVDSYQDPDRYGKPQVDIRWTRSMSYFGQVVNEFLEVKRLIAESQWPFEMAKFLELNMLSKSEDQSVIALFSNLLTAIQE